MLTSLVLLSFVVVLGEGVNPCTLCNDGSAVTLPNYLVQIPGYPQLSCSSVASLTPTLLPDETVPECTLARQVSSLCGCPVLPGSCSLCKDGTKASKRHVELKEFAGIFGGNIPTCELVEAYLRSFDKSHEICSASRESVATICGCSTTNQTVNNTNVTESSTSDNATDLTNVIDKNANNSFFTRANDIVSGAKFYGAQTEEDLSRLYRLSRSASILSAISCIAVIVDCFRLKQRRKNLYNQIVGTMTIFDLIYSISMAFGTLPMDKNDPFVSPGEYGNAATCKIQGAALQWGGLTSLFLNCALSTYYLLVVVYNTKESRLRDIRKWLLGVPIALGSILGFSSVPFIQNGIVSCQLTPPVPIVSTDVLRELGLPHTYWQFLTFMVVPSYIAIFYSTCVICLILLHMRKVDQKSKKWRTSRRYLTSDASKKRKPKSKATALTKLRREVFQQCLQYLAAVYLTWLVYVSVTVKSDRFLTSHYELWILVFILGGIQGFLNSMIYFRPRLVRYWRNWKKTNKKKQREKRKESTPSFSEGTSTNNGSSSIKPWGEVAQAEPAVDIIAALAASIELSPQEYMDEENSGTQAQSGPELSNQEENPGISIESNDDESTDCK